MKNTHLSICTSICAAVMVGVTSPALAMSDASKVKSEIIGNTAVANMMSPTGKSLGKVRLEQTPHGVLISVSLKGIPNGGHGFHLHETGTCAPNFAAAGGHFNPLGHGHGIKHEDGIHAGDFPNIYAINSRVRADVLAQSITLGAGKTNIFDADGSAIIVHEKPDTYGSAAGAGGRIACGVVKQR